MTDYDKWIADIWPQERDFIAQPDRIKYLRKMVKVEGCVFCHSRDKGPSEESLCVYKNSHAMVVLNKYPYNGGHMLVLPLRHIARLDEMEEDEFVSLSLLVKQTVQAVESAFKCEGINVGLNLGTAAGAGIPGHLHWHIVPRWSGDTNFFPLIANTKVIPSSLEETYKSIIKYFPGGEAK